MFQRFTCEYKLAGTKSFRLSSAKLLGIWGNNAQNINRNNLNIFIPDPGMVFIQADQRAAEALVVAYECSPGRFQDLFHYGIKPHTYMAMHLYPASFGAEHLLKLSIQELATHKDWSRVNNEIKHSGKPYDIGKMTIHARNYREGPNIFRMSCLERSGGTLVISAPESKQFLAKHETLFPEVVEWQNKIEGIARSSRELCNLHGYPCKFYGRFSDQLVKKMLSWIPQSTVGIITSLAVVKLQTRIEQQDLPWDILNNKHDSLLAQVPISDRDQGIEEMRNALRCKLTSTTGIEYMMDVDISVGMNWGKYSKDNPNGLKEI